MLPFTLVDALGWVMIPVVSVTSFLVLCIEQLAVQIENPFGYDANDLPLHSFTCTVEARPLGHKSAPHPQRRGSPAPRPSRRLLGGAMHSQPSAWSKAEALRSSGEAIWCHRYASDA